MILKGCSGIEEEKWAELLRKIEDFEAEEKRETRKLAKIKRFEGGIRNVR